jgi:vacuolar protein sorting-associated protein 11
METLEEETDDDESDEILQDIQEALTIARRQAVLPPVRIARILAGEGSGQFSTDIPIRDKKRTIPLSVALDYVGTVLEKSRREASRLKSEIEEYNQICNSMENDIASLLRVSFGLPPLANDDSATLYDSRFNIDELFAKMKSEESGSIADVISEQTREAFWREMNQTEDSFDTIARYFAKGAIG